VAATNARALREQNRLPPIDVLGFLKHDDHGSLIHRFLPHQLRLDERCFIIRVCCFACSFA